MTYCKRLKNILQNVLASTKFNLKKALGKDDKVFIIGRNKTGTTSLKNVFESLGYKIGDQATAELFIDDYADRNFDNILAYCDSAEVFQDAPFSWPDTYKYVFKKYPNAKYILLERETSEIWFDSLTRFHSKIVNDGNPINADSLKNHTYRRKGFLWQAQQVVYGVDEVTLYDKTLYMKNYEDYNAEVKDFFASNENFLNLTLSDPDATDRLAHFLNMKPSDIKIPHLNKSN